MARSPSFLLFPLPVTARAAQAGPQLRANLDRQHGVREIPGHVFLLPGQREGVDLEKKKGEFCQNEDRTQRRPFCPSLPRALNSPIQRGQVGLGSLWR